MTQARRRSAPTTNPGKSPARKTPAGKVFFDSPCCLESMLEERLPEVVAAAETVVGVEVAEVDVADEDAV
jgi:hypothetical protein